MCIPYLYFLKLKYTSDIAEWQGSQNKTKWAKMIYSEQKIEIIPCINAINYQ